MLKPHLPTLGDIENDTLPSGFPSVVDAHVQCFDINADETERMLDVCRLE